MDELTTIESSASDFFDFRSSVPGAFISQGTEESVRMIEMAAGDLVGVLLDPYSEIDNASELTVPLIEEIDYNSGVLLQTLEVHT